MKIVNLSILLITFVLLGCQKSNSSLIKATIQDFTGLDGCGYVIQLEDQSYLEPVNLTDFASSVTITDNQKVWVKFKEVSGGSICMVGKIVEIKEIYNR